MRALLCDLRTIEETQEIEAMLNPINIISLEQGRMPVRGEDEYYRLAPHWKEPVRLGRFLGWIRRARTPDVEQPDEQSEPQRA